MPIGMPFLASSGEVCRPRLHSRARRRPPHHAACAGCAQVLGGDVAGVVVEADEGSPFPPGTRVGFLSDGEPAGGEPMRREGHLCLHAGREVGAPTA